MAVHQLSPDVISLIHHVELNESGWWKKAFGQILQGLLWKATLPKTPGELTALLKAELGLSLSLDVVETQLGILEKQEVVTRLLQQSYKLAEHARERLTTAREKIASEQKLCRDAFLVLCHEHCAAVNAEHAWTVFNQSLLVAVRIAGANLFHLVSDGKLEKEIDWDTSFFGHFETKHHEGLRQTLASVFAPTNQLCRSQILRLLSAHFFAEASQLNPETLQAIEGKRTKRTIKVVLDTNFVFSVLELHDNPSNDAVLSLMDIAKKSGRHLEIRFYVLPGTLEEAKRTLLGQMRMVEGLRTTMAMARAAVGQPLPSIATKFFAAASRTSGLSARAFFQPYVDDLRIILRDKGIAVLETHDAVYNQRQDVVDDVIAEQHREDTEVKEAKRKGYERVLHDAVLWHAVKDRRPSHADSPFEVEYWAVTLDWRLIAFDRRKRSSSASHLPVVLHPSNLVQLLQFWMPRSKELEEGLVDSLGLPLYFDSFDHADEKATMRVLEALSRYENVHDLQEPTVRSILANRALRARLRDGEPSNEQVFELVREELLTEHHRVLEGLSETQNSLVQTKVELDNLRNERESAQNERRSIEELLAQSNNRMSEAERRAHEALAASQKREQDYQIKLRAAEDGAASERKNAARREYVLLFLLAPIIFGVLTALLIWTAKPFGSETWIALSAALMGGLLPGALACALSAAYSSRRAELKGWRLTSVLNAVGKKAVVAPILLALTAIFQGGIWDAFKILLSSS